MQLAHYSASVVFQALDDINVLMRTEKNTVRKRLLAEETTSGASDQNGGVTYVTASGEIISASDLVTAEGAAGPDTKRFIVPAAAGATNMQVLHVINSSGTGTSTAVNTKLESILDDRSQ